MNTLNKYGSNFLNLILGKCSLNIGDSFYMVAISVAFIEAYHINVGELSLFALLGMLPGMLAFLYGVYIEKIENKKTALIFFQMMHILLLCMMIAVLYYRADVVYVYILNVLFMLVNTIQNTLEISIVPNILDYDEDLINKSVDIQYMTGNVLNIVSDFVASVLLGLISYLLVMSFSIPFFVAGIFFFSRIVAKKVLDTDMNSDLDYVQINSEFNDEGHIDEYRSNIGEFGSTEEGQSKEITEENQNASGYISDLKSSFNHYKSGGFASFIIFIEALLSGAIDMLIKLSPLYLVFINVDLKWIGLVYATQKLADLIGALVSPFVKIGINKFFYLDYMITGIMLTMVFIIPNPIIKLVLFFISFIIIGISGNYFNKMLFKYFDPERLGSLMTIIHTLYATFGLLFLIIPMFYSNIQVLGIVLNSLTFVFGVVLILIPKKKDSIEE